MEQKKYNTGALFVFPLVADGAADFVTDYTPAAGDAKVWTDKLISTNLTSLILGFDSLSELPGLADIPILGALFRSTQFQRDETELVIIVTVYTVNPVKEEDLSLPTDGLMHAHHMGTILLKRLNRLTWGTEVNPDPRTNQPSSAPGAPSVSLIGSAGFHVE